MKGITEPKQSKKPNNVGYRIINASKPSMILLTFLMIALTPSITGKNNAA